MNETTKEISDNCNVCKGFKRTPGRPVVCMPSANRFNEVVAMDLKHFKDRVYFFHLLDLFSRISISQVMTRKLPSVIVDVIIKMWIASGFRSPQKKFLIDNVGEFV